MRQIERTTRFGKDFKRESKGPHGPNLNALLAKVLSLLINDIALPVRYRDPPLTGQWKLHRDCHLKPDLVLIYRSPDADTLQLVRLGSHCELGL